MNLGMQELLLIGVIALLLFGPKKLPELGRSLGDAIRGFKKGLSDADAPEKEVNKTQISQNPQQPINKQTVEEHETEKKS